MKELLSKLKKTSVCLSVLISFSAVADPVTTCTNSCVITHNSDGTITIRDCCGGRVITTFPANSVA